MKDFDQLDILINTAGVVLKKPFIDITEEEYDRKLLSMEKPYFF